MLQNPATSIPHPSLSRNLHSDESTPLLLHSLHENKSSVLSLAADDNYIYSGSQNRNISVWDKKTFVLKDTLKGHTGSVLALEYAKDKEWLFSSSGDSTVRVWSTVNLQPLYVIVPYLEDGAGDLFSISWSDTMNTLFLGCQNTSLQWYKFSESILEPCESQRSIYNDSLIQSGATTPANATTPRKAHKFFDSYPQYERKPADIFANNGVTSSGIPGRDSPDSGSTTPCSQMQLSVPATNVIDSAHYGYVYCMTLIHYDSGTQLATGSGDETIKLWDCTPSGPNFIYEIACNHGAVLALVAKGDTIYAGCQDGYVKVMDLETKTFVRTIIVQESVDIISMSLLNSDLYTCSANGWVKCWSPSFDCTASWIAHDGIVLSSIVSCRNGSEKEAICLVTGGNDGHIKIWDVLPPKLVAETKEVIGDDSAQHTGNEFNADTLTYALSKFISIPSVSCDLAHREDCRQAAIWLKKCLSQLGAHTSLLTTGEGNNPLVFGTFEGSVRNYPHKKPRVLFYGHYDVIPAPKNGWSSDPYTLMGRNGYLYGRGATDNKGPIIAVACAAAELLSRRALEVDLVFLIEGEEECGSTGFGEAVRKYKSTIGHIDSILVSNSTWIAEDRPCITYGLRGVVHCSLEIFSDLPDLHSGIEGGAVAEPMFDMIKLLATLTNDENQVQIPGFYDRVRPQTKEEKELYKLLSGITDRPASSLASRWCEPSLTIHNIEISGPKNATVIPGKVKAQVSIRIVPDQSLETVAQSLSEFLKSSFKKLKSPNTLKTNIEHTADWWLGNLQDPWFKTLESAVREEWGEEPLRIREGGSIPSIPFLEKEFGCHALHLPMGQSTDQAHLPNERISLSNLRKGKAVVERFLLNAVDKCTNSDDNCS